MSLAETAPSKPPVSAPPFKLMGQIAAYRTTQCIRVLVELDIPVRLHEQPQTLDALAKATATLPQLLERVLQHLVHEGVIAMDNLGSYIPSPVTCYLLPDHPQSLRNWIACELDPLLWRSWENLTGQLRTGRTAFDLTHGAPFFEWHAQDAAAQKRFDDQMTGASRGIGAVAAQELTFGPDTHILDVGGGNGLFLAQVLDRNPGTRGTLFDLPRSVEDFAPLFAEKRSQNRAEAVTGSFFDAVPKGADVYLFSRVFHDFDDAAAAAILHNTRRALDGHERLFLIDMMAGAQDAGSRASSQDIFMLTQLGGRERTGAEFSSLLADCGFETLSIKPTASPVSILEFRPATAIS